jgi:hypothetical protein
VNVFLTALAQTRADQATEFRVFRLEFDTGRRCKEPRRERFVDFGGRGNDLEADSTRPRLVGSSLWPLGLRVGIVLDIGSICMVVGGVCGLVGVAEC